MPRFHLISYGVRFTLSFISPFTHVKNQHGVDGIGISFPNYKYEEKDGKTFATLGNKRIFANTGDELDKLALPVA